MGLSTVTAPASEPVTAAEAKSHMNITFADDDTLITDMIKAARIAVENYVSRKLINQTLDYTLDVFPNVIVLPVGPASSITSLSYIDTAGASQTWSSSNYQTDLTVERARIAPVSTTAWPAIDTAMNAVTVRYVAGFGATASDVPEVFKLAIKIFVASMYENREAEAPIMISQVPRLVERLLDPEKTWNL